jgi:hypothetical protein
MGGTILMEKLEKYQDVIKKYQEFKKLREIMGKPVETTITPEIVKKNLTSKEFLALIEEIKREKH